MLSKITYLKRQGQDGAHKAYKACQSQEAKRTWFWDVYMKDPSLSSFNQVKHQHATKKTDKSLEEGQWLTARQILAENGYFDESSSDYKVAQVALLAGLDERDLEKPETAALGHKQYNYSWSKTVKSAGSTTFDILEMVSEVDDKTALKWNNKLEAGDCEVQDENP